MRFEINGTQITGSYYYDSQKKEISISGEASNASFSLEEKYKEKITGYFTSEVFTPDSISGNWKSPKGKVFDFALFSSSDEEYQSSMKELEQSWTKEELLEFSNEFKSMEIPFDYEPIDWEAEGRIEMTTEEIRKFIYPEYDPETEFGTTYFYGVKYETESYIALIYTQFYIPGAFGINNRTLYMNTYDKNGKLIKSGYLGCQCLDNNYYDYDETFEKFHIMENQILVTGTYTSASHEWAEEEGMETFSNVEEISRKINISLDGKF